MAARARASRRRGNVDGAWKRVLTDLLPGCLAFAVPELHAAVDWTVQPLSLDKEFAAMARGAAIGPRVADHLVQLRLRSGDVTWLVLHVEVQGRPQDDFAARLFTYYALIHLRLWRRRKGATPPEPPPLILGLAILTDDRAAWHPGPYRARAFGQGLSYDSWTVKLLDWRDRAGELATSNNPFALVAAAWLGVLAARGRVDNLTAIARATMRQLYRGGYNDQERATINAFLEQVTLSGIELLRLEEEIRAEEMSEEGANMGVTSIFERNGLRKGREEGRREAYLEMILRMLNRKFGPIGESTTELLGMLEDEQLQELHDAAFDFAGQSDLDRWLRAASAPS